MSAENLPKTNVVYLMGAGATHGNIQHVASPHGILMRDLKQPLADAIHALINRKKAKYGALLSLVNDFSDTEANIEHVITFLDQSPSAVHRSFANDLRLVFQKILQHRLDTIKRDIGDGRFSLYAALLDMHQIHECHEVIRGILTINYDEYIEDAFKAVYRRPVDYGIRLHGRCVTARIPTLLKLHGSFGWTDTWPVSRARGGQSNTPLWIPPGIHKAKEHYPFNVLWGLAREMLDCDVLRIIGCNLGATDWDLISMLFTTRHSKVEHYKPYIVEVIDSPEHAVELQQSYPYLDIRSILEIDYMDIGRQLVAEMSEGPPREYRSLPGTSRNALGAKPELKGTGSAFGSSIWQKLTREILARAER